MCEKEQKQKQPPANGLQANWAMDGIHISGNYKMQKLEILTLIVCILLAIICGTFLYATFFSANSSNHGPMVGEDNKHLHKEIEALRNQIGQMRDEAKTQKALEKLQNLTIADLRAMIDQTLNEANGRKALVKLQKETIHELRAEIDQSMDKEKLQNKTADELVEKLRAKIEQQAEEIGKMVHEAIAQKSLELSLNKTIDDLHAKIETQTTQIVQYAGHLNKENEALRSHIGQMVEEARAQKALEKVQNETIAELRASVEKQQAKEKVEANIVQKKLYNPKGNRFYESNRNVKISRDGLKVENTLRERQHVYAEQRFDISGDSRKRDNFTGTIIYYFEVKQTSPGQFCTGLSDGSILVGCEHVGESPNSYGRPNRDFCWISGIKHAFEWPEGVNKPKWNGPSTGDVSGCGLLLSPDNKVAIFFTLDGILLGKPIPISPPVHHLYPTVTIYTSLEANFGDDPDKPFSFEVNKCPRLAFP